MEKNVILALDIGGSKYMPGFVDEKGNILFQERRVWEKTDQQSILEQISRAVADLRESQPELWARAAAGGLTIPGFADPMTGTWVESDFLPVKDLDICGILQRKFGIPFYADNDGNACALAEKYFGGGKNRKNFLYMTVSTGIGGAPFLDGQLYYGDFWHAGEIGLFVEEEVGRWSDTGSMRGIVEMHASGRGLAENFLALGGRKEYKGKPCGGPEISALAEQGDQPAQDALWLEGLYLGRVIAKACAMMDFQKVILGGGVSLLFEKYRQPLLEEFQRIWPGRAVEIEATTLGYSGAFLGAAAVAMRGLENEPIRPVRSRIRIRVGESLQSSLSVNGKTYPMALDRFLVSSRLSDSGKSLEMVCWEQTGYPLGYAVGKAAAASAMLLDPGAFLVEGLEEDAERQGFLEALTKETYYRGKFPFTVTFSRETEEIQNECITAEYL